MVPPLGGVSAAAGSTAASRLGFELRDPADRPGLTNHVRPTLERVIEPVVGPDQADGVVLDGLGVGDGAVQANTSLDGRRGDRHESASTTASTSRPRMGSATAATASP